MKNITNSIISIVRMLIISIVFIFIIKMISNNIGNETIKESLRYLAFVFSTLLCAKLFDKLTYKSMGLRFSSEVIMYFILGICVVVVLYIIMSCVFLNNSNECLNVMSIFNEKSNILYWLLVAIGEEIVFRGFIIGIINKNFKNITSIIISTILFSLVHVVSYEYVSIYSYIYIFIVGFFLACICTNLNSIGFGIGYHFIWNCLDSIFEGTKIEGIMMLSVLVVLFVIVIISRKKEILIN